MRTIDKNETKRKISTPTCVMDVQGKRQKENVPMAERMCKLEDDVVERMCKLEEDMVTKLNEIKNLIKNIGHYD